MTSLRRELERESILYGELRAQAACHEAIARDALARLEASEARERKHLRDLGSAREHVAELAATLGQLRARPAAPRAPRGHQQSRSLANAKTRRPRAARNQLASTAGGRIKPRTRKAARAKGRERQPLPGSKKTPRIAPAALRSRR